MGVSVHPLASRLNVLFYIVPVCDEGATGMFLKHTRDGLIDWRMLGSRYAPSKSCILGLFERSRLRYRYTISPTSVDYYRFCRRDTWFVLRVNDALVWPL